MNIKEQALVRIADILREAVEVHSDCVETRDTFRRAIALAEGAVDEDLAQVEELVSVVSRLEDTLSDSDRQQVLEAIHTLLKDSRGFLNAMDRK